MLTSFAPGSIGGVGAATLAAALGGGCGLAEAEADAEALVVVVVAMGSGSGGAVRLLHAATAANAAMGNNTPKEREGEKRMAAGKVVAAPRK